jgi:outer membrane receptor protein involved in Fe transport
MRTRVLAGCWLLIAMLHPAHSLAQAPPSAQEEERELEDLVQILSEETAVATKTRMNGDFVPGIVTVLHGDELLALGIETVWEALALVPGMQAVRDPDATPSVIVRGVDFPFNSGNVKVLVNGVSLSRQNAGLNGIVLQIPIAEVERIEVIRGPGSVVYGDFAFMGLVNILTRRPGARAFLRGSEGEALSGGGSYTWQHAAGRTEASLQAAGFKNGDARVPAPRSAEEERGFGALSLRRGGLSLSAHAVARELRQTAPGAAVSEQTHWALEGRYGFELSSSLRPELRASYLDNHFETRFIGFDGGVAEAGLELPWQAGRHCWLFATSFSH